MKRIIYLSLISLFAVNTNWAQNDYILDFSSRFRDQWPIATYNRSRSKGLEYRPKHV